MKIFNNRAITKEPTKKDERLLNKNMYIFSSSNVYVGLCLLTKVGTDLIENRILKV